MPKPAEIIAALGDVSAIDRYETLRAEIVDLFTMLSDRMKDWNDKRPALIMQKMAATVGSIPYEVLAEFGHNYNPTLLTLVIYLRITSAAGFEVADYESAHDFLVDMLDELRSIDLDHPDTQKAIEEIKVIFKSTGRPTG